MAEEIKPKKQNWKWIAFSWIFGCSIIVGLLSMLAVIAAHSFGMTKETKFFGPAILYSLVASMIGMLAGLWLRFLLLLEERR